MTKILIDRTVVEQAVKALENRESTPVEYDTYHALRAALEQPQVEQPVAWMFHSGDIWKFKWHHFDRPLGDEALEHWKPLYTHPQQPVVEQLKREPLSDEQIDDLKAQATEAWRKANFRPALQIFVARAIEAAHGIGGEK